MFCIKCGTKLPDEAVFCMKCGTKLPDMEALDKEPICQGASEESSFSESSSENLVVATKPFYLTSVEIEYGSLLIAKLNIPDMLSLSKGQKIDVKIVGRIYHAHVSNEVTTQIDGLSELMKIGGFQAGDLFTASYDCKLNCLELKHAGARELKDDDDCCIITNSPLFADSGTLYVDNSRRDNGQKRIASDGSVWTIDLCQNPFYDESLPYDPDVPESDPSYSYYLKRDGRIISIVGSQNNGFGYYLSEEKNGLITITDNAFCSDIATINVRTLEKKPISYFG